MNSKKRQFKHKPCQSHSIIKNKITCSVGRFNLPIAVAIVIHEHNVENPTLEPSPDDFKFEFDSRIDSTILSLPGNLKQEKVEY